MQLVNILYLIKIVYAFFYKYVFILTNESNSCPCGDLSTVSLKYLIERFDMFHLNIVGNSYSLGKVEWY